jgi:hypothetical protein
VDNAAASSERIPVKAGQKVQVEFWGRSKDKAFVVVTLIFLSEGKKWATDVDEKLRNCPVNNMDGKWQKHKFDALIPDHVDTVVVWVHSWSTAKGSADVDDFVLTLR